MAVNNNFLILVILLVAALQVHAERVDSVQQNPNIGKSASAASAFLATGTQFFTINLPQIQADLTPSITGAHKTGVVYPLPSPVTAVQMPWEPVIGGYVAHIHLFSNQAKRLRCHLVFREETASIEFRIQGSLDVSPIGPIDHTFVHDSEMWLPVTNGNNADLEIFVNDTKPPEALDFSIDAVNVIIDDLNSGDIPGIMPQTLGLAKEQEFDLVCWANNWASSKDVYPALEQAASATAKINFIEDGASFICTGTLLNDKGSTRTPWLATANHCISDQPTANTASFEWFFQATVCGGSTRDSRYAQTYGGARLLWTDGYLEASLLRLNEPPPNGVIFSAWDTGIQAGDLVWGVHHPEGDHTMVSKGNVAALLETLSDQTGRTHLLNVVNYVYGGTELGSSGSGLFSAASGFAYWKGTLFGGPINNYQTSLYSDFNSYYTNIKPWLENTKTLNDNIECLLNWAEKTYSNLFSPAGATSQFQSPYIYRYYGNTNAYVGVSSVSNHVYYLGPDRVLQDVGALSGWLTTALCQ